MSKAKIAIVEDEAIVAEDIKQMLITLGYEVVGLAATADEARVIAQEKRPDLILMDIRIKGDRDGIETAEEMLVEFNIPVTYLTAYADEKTLERAKATLPYGYIIKPFEEKDLQTVIEVALYRHQLQSSMDSMEAWHSSTLRSLPWGVVTADLRGKVNYLNAAAESLLGIPMQELLGKDLANYFPEGNKSGVESAVEMAIPIAGGRSVKVKVAQSALRNVSKTTGGRVVMFHK